MKYNMTKKIIDVIVGGSPVAPEVTQEVDALLQEFAITIVHKWEAHSSANLAVVVPDKICEEVKNINDE